MDGSRGELQGRPAGSPNKRFCHLPLHLHKLAGAPSPPQPCHTAGTAGRGGHQAWPPAPPLTGPLPSPAEPPNRAPVTPSPSPRPSLAKPDGGSPEFGRTAAARPPRGYIAKEKIFPRASLQKVNSISKTLWLILVNFVENHRKIRKMQGQFC
jgi:hypothetical protein